MFEFDLPEVGRWFAEHGALRPFFEGEALWYLAFWGVSMATFIIYILVSIVHFAVMYFVIGDVRGFIRREGPSRWSRSSR